MARSLGILAYLPFLTYFESTSIWKLCTIGRCVHLENTNTDAATKRLQAPFVLQGAWVATTGVPPQPELWSGKQVWRKRLRFEKGFLLQTALKIVIPVTYARPITTRWLATSCWLGCAAWCAFSTWTKQQVSQINPAMMMWSSASHWRTLKLSERVHCCQLF